MAVPNPLPRDESEAGEEMGRENRGPEIVPAIVAKLDRPDAKIAGCVDALLARGFVNAIEGAKEYLDFIG